MLVLSRHRDESIMIGDDIVVTEAEVTPLFPAELDLPQERPMGKGRRNAFRARFATASVLTLTDK